MHPDGYFALVLDTSSSTLLKEEFATLPNLIAHHCTVRYGTDRPEDLPAPFRVRDLGKRFYLRVIGTGRIDGKLEAAVVALVLPDGTLQERGFSENTIPHVTIATDGEEEPAGANAMLEGGFTRVDGPMLVARLEHTREGGKKSGE